MSGVIENIRLRGISIEFKMVLFISVTFALAASVLIPLIQLVIFSFRVPLETESGQLIYGDNGRALTRTSIDAWRFALTQPGMLESLWNTFTVTVTRQLIGFPVAILFAWLIGRTDMPGGRALEFLFWIVFFLPIVSVVQSWILLAHPSYGILNQLLAKLPFIETGPFNIFGFWGIVWAHLIHSTIAVKVMLLTPAFRNMDASLEDASRISGASNMGTLFRVTLPILAPALATMFLITLVAGLQSVEIEILLGLPERFFVFGSKIYNLTRIDPPLFNEATALGVLVLIAVIPFTIWHRWISRRRRYTTISSDYKPQPLQLRAWRWPAFTVVLSWALICTLAPVITLTMGTFMKVFGFFSVPSGAWTLDNWRQILTDPNFVLSFKNGLYLSFGAATLSVILFTILAYIIVRVQSRISDLTDILTWVPLAMPGVILLLGWLWVFLRIPFLTPLYGTLFALILVSALSRVTIGVQFVKSNLLQLSAELEEASTISGAGWWYTFRRVVVPILAPLLAALWVMNFVWAMGSALVPLFLATPESRPLALLQFEYVAAGKQEAASVVGVIVIILTVGVAVAARFLGFRGGLSETRAISGNK